MLRFFLRESYLQRKLHNNIDCRRDDDGAGSAYWPFWGSLSLPSSPFPICCDSKTSTGNQGWIGVPFTTRHLPPITVDLSFLLPLWNFCFFLSVFLFLSFYISCFLSKRKWYMSLNIENKTDMPYCFVNCICFVYWISPESQKKSGSFEFVKKKIYLQIALNEVQDP